MARNGELEDGNGGLFEDAMSFVENSELMDDSFESLDASEESCVLYASKQSPIAIESSEDLVFDFRYSSDYCESGLELSQAEELLSDDADQDSPYLLRGWNEGSLEEDGRYEPLRGNAYAFIHDDSSLAYDADLEIIGGHAYHSTFGNAPQDGTGDNAWQSDPSALLEHDDSDIVVVESRSLSETYPRVSHEVLSTVLCKVYLAYYSLVSIDSSGPEYFLSNLGFNLGSRALSDILRDLSPEEIEYLRSKVRRILLNDINNAQIIESLVSLIDPHKIDWILCRKELKAVKFKDMIDRSTTSCTICYESFRPGSMCISLKCMHTFHSKCVRCWVKQSWCCPLCRCKDI